MIKKNLRVARGFSLLFYFSHPKIPTDDDVAKATVAMRVDTTEQEVAVLFSHFPPFCTRSLCFSVKICCGDSSFLLKAGNEVQGFEFFTYCHKMLVSTVTSQVIIRTKLIMIVQIKVMSNSYILHF